jgi:hypothetical protein
MSGAAPSCAGQPREFPPTGSCWKPIRPTYCPAISCRDRSHGATNRAICRISPRPWRSYATSTLNALGFFGLDRP